MLQEIHIHFYRSDIEPLRAASKKILKIAKQASQQTEQR
jgi:hypothetical protein